VSHRVWHLMSACQGNVCVRTLCNVIVGTLSINWIILCRVR